MSTIYDVARRADVSAATVSRVLNGQVRVNPQLTERVNRAIKELNYTPNGVARSLRRKSARAWALIVSEVESAHVTSFARAVEDVAHQHGISLVLCNSDGDPARESRYLEVVIAEQMAGVILSPTRPDTDIAILRDNGVPVVTIDRQLDRTDVNAVIVDNARAAENAVNHLLDGGYRRIACITGPSHVSTANQRLAGYYAALATHDIPLDHSLIRAENDGEGGGWKAMAELLELPEPPDAVLTASSLLTVGALRALKHHGIRIPQGFGVVGFDDNPWLQVIDPPLTTVAQPTYGLGQQAAELLLSADDAHTAVYTLNTTLVIRNSSQR